MEELDLMAYAAFSAAEVTPSNTGAGFYEEQDVTCTRCGAVFVSSEAEALKAMRAGMPLCPAEVGELVPSHSIEEKALLALLGVYTKMSLVDLAPYFSADGTDVASGLRLVKSAVHALAASGEVVVTDEYPEVTRYIRKKIGAPKIIDTFNVGKTEVIEVSRTVYKLIPVPPQVEMHVALAA